MDVLLSTLVLLAGTFKGIESQESEIVDCPVDYSSSPYFKNQWSEWGEWGDCDATCLTKQGFQERTRSCQSLSKGFCTGVEKDYKPCSIIDSNNCTSWGIWGAWGGCEYLFNSCAKVQYRQRDCMQRGKIVSVENCTGTSRGRKACPESEHPFCIVEPDQIEPVFPPSGGNSGNDGGSGTSSGDYGAAGKK